MNETWKKIYDAAVSVLAPKEISPQMQVGIVGAAVMSKAGHIYTGINVDTDCGLGFCAERNAISNMLTHGEFEIDKICSVHVGGGVASPCGACREFMSHMGEGAGGIEILLDTDGRTKTLVELLPESWL